jgi:hypothetical protein
MRPISSRPLVQRQIGALAELLLLRFLVADARKALEKVGLELSKIVVDGLKRPAARMPP